MKLSKNNIMWLFILIFVFPPFFAVLVTALSFFIPAEKKVAKKEVAVQEEQLPKVVAPVAKKADEAPKNDLVGREVGRRRGPKERDKESPMKEAEKKEEKKKEGFVDGAIRIIDHLRKGGNEQPPQVKAEPPLDDQAQPAKPPWLGEPAKPFKPAKRKRASQK